MVASGVDERTLKREGVCAASLPTTMVRSYFCLNTVVTLLFLGKELLTLTSFVFIDAAWVIWLLNHLVVCGFLNTWMGPKS